MPAVKIPESLREELAGLELAVWIAIHPMIYDTVEKFNKGQGRHDTTRVQVQLAGPGLGGQSPWGCGKNLQEAVNDALHNSLVIDRVPGLKGALMRLDAAIGGLQQAVLWNRWKYGGDQDDEIPF